MIRGLLSAAIQQGSKLNYPNPNIQTTLTFQSVQPATVQQVSLILKADIDSDITIDFNDGGGATALTANGHIETHTSNYSSGSATYDITLSGDLFALKKILVENNSTLKLNINDFKTNNVGLTELDLKDITGEITGTLANLCPSLLKLRLDNIGSLITGSTDSLSKKLTLLYLINHPNITGSLQNLSQYLFAISIVNCPLISGNIEYFAEDTRMLYLSDLAQTITGSIDNLPSKRLKTLVLERLGTGINGSINSLVNSEKIYYAGLMYLVISPTSSTNAFTGSLDTLMSNQTMPVNLTTNPNGYYWVSNFRLELNNLGINITGSLDSLKAISPIDNYYKPTSIAHAIIIKNSGILTYSNGELPVYSSVPITIHCGLTTSELDNFLVEFSNKSTASLNYDIFDLSGNNEGHTDASNAAIDALVTEYRNVYLNDPVGVTNFDITLGVTYTVGTPVILYTLVNNRRFAKCGVDWGDGSPIEYVYNQIDSANVFTHSYATNGTKTIKIINAYGLKKLIIQNWKNVTGSLNQFENCNYMTSFGLSSVGTGGMTGSLNSVQNPNLLTLSAEKLGSAVTLNLDDLATNAPALTSLYVFNMASGNVTGSIKNLPTGLTMLLLWLVGNAFDISTGPHPSWAATTINMQNNHASTAVDAFLNSWAATAGAGTKTITLTRSRTSASDAAVTTLNGLGKTINTSG